MRDTNNTLNYFFNEIWVEFFNETIDVTFGERLMLNYEHYS